ncbi:NAD(P)/FAD-dependent oxidoreductase [Marisediminicola antarctica]|uniref:Pyridine nucleotide-disulfide oxidoreductase n=1 Tax=Marisediminicola antarctica TaxID=674079 RepID=A0A7L5AIQ2_9MICO|nr:NAD(P)/FAD-dependent oxidoreductase [Marisediminicola antarctica]QHO69001.1 pyridine nucleotide-disulfide oxidoreductase [Marisediminicola antarctica]
MTEVLIIGAGPAGLAAARAARRRGASVVVLDSSDQLGGQYWRHLPAERPSAREHTLHHHFRQFEALSRELDDDAGCRILRNAQVWAIEQGGGSGASATAGTLPGASAGPGTVHVLLGEPDGANRERLVFRPDRIVLATGAHDRTLPFPGWDLPGVFTGGAAQALAKGERIVVGDRVVVAGAGPFLLPVAAALAKTGSGVVGVFEASGAPALARGWLPRPWQLVSAGGKALELAGYVAGQLRHRIPYSTGRAVVAAHGTDRVEAVTIADVDADWVPIPGTRRRIAADAVCVSHGFTPRLELAIAAGCALSPERFVTVDDGQQTTVAGVYAAGEITGIGGVDLALAEGEVAGHVAAGGAASDPSVGGAVRRRRVFASFARRIEAAHGIRPGWPAMLESDTIVCRCEEVTYGRLCRVADSTASRSLRALKLSTRAGLGICQGRICGRSVEELLQARTGGLGDGSSTDRRPIAAPIRLGELAAGTTAHPDTYDLADEAKGTQ